MAGIGERISLSGLYVFQFLDPESHQVTREFEAPNAITRSGKTFVLRMLLDVGTYDSGITYAALGDGATVVSDRDTGLGNELVRQRVTQRANVSGLSASFLTFFPAATIPATIEEVGMFGHDAASVLGSGTLFSRVLRSIAGASGEDLLLTYVLEVT